MTPQLKSLKQGDTIGIIAPASPVTHDEIEPAIRIIHRKGYMVLEGEHLYDTRGYLAGRDEDRLNDLHSMFRNSNVKAVLCARGGYGTPRLLDRIDYDIIKQNPKLFIGYSDITALLLAIYHKTGLVVWHGPMLRGQEGREDNLNNMIELLSSEEGISFRLAADNIVKKGNARGRLIGGNLSLICSLLGTPFFPSFDDCILFIEDRGEPLYRIDRMITQLKLAGILDGINGLITGYFKECGDIKKINDFLSEAIPLDCPFYAGYPAGHGIDNRALPFGIEAEIDTESLTLTIDSFVS